MKPDQTEAMVKYDRKAKGAACPCGGQLMFGGSGWRELPVGFGFRGSRFVVDKVRYYGYFGQCLQCGKQVFAFTRKRLVTKDLTKKVLAKAKQSAPSK